MNERGVLSHESAMQGGVALKLLKIGSAPKDWIHIDYAGIKYDEEL